MSFARSIGVPSLMLGCFAVAAIGSAVLGLASAHDTPPAESNQRDPGDH